MKTTMNRRAFLAATAASVAGLAAVGCSPENEVESTGSDNAGTVAESDEPIWKIDTELTSETGYWQTASCNWNCGGKCWNQVYIEDGIVIRQKTDDSPNDSLDGNTQRRACPRGLSNAQAVLNPNRLMYPMKRKHWEPGTGGDRELRGRDEWERISWDEAIEYVAAEFKRIIENYGNEGIYCHGVAHSTHFINLAFGGYLGGVDTMSFGTAERANVAAGIFGGVGTLLDQPDMNDRYDFINIDNIVLYGLNSAWASNPQALHYLKGLTKPDANFVYVGPSYNLTASSVNARWIQVRPGTDTPFLMAVAYEMFEMDAAEGKGSTIDWDFLEKYTYGIDGDHMAPGIESDENFRDYLYGAYDGQVKNAEWASEICGATPEDIRFYADLQRKGNKTYTFWSFAPARSFDSDYWLILMYTIAWMGGHIGKSGEGCSAAYHASAFRTAAPKGLIWPGMGDDWTCGNPCPKAVNVNFIWDAIVNGTEVVFGERKRSIDTEYTKGTVDVHAIYCPGQATILGRADASLAIKAFRKVEFVLATGWAFRPECQFADIVLPVQTNWETEFDAVYDPYCLEDPEAIYIPKRVVEPVYEALDIIEVYDRLAVAMGIDPASYAQMPRKQQAFNHAAMATYRDVDGEWKPLMTITQEDIDRWGVEGEPQEGDKITLSEFEKTWMYKLPRERGDEYSKFLAFQDYLADPEGNPRNTSSGRWQIHNPEYAEYLNALPYTPGFAWKPYPVYKPAMRGYTERTEETPFQLYEPHYLRRRHTQGDENPHMREAFTQPLFMNAQDAEKLGLVQGDTVRVYNQFGAVLRPVSIMNTMMPGVVALPHGAWMDWDDENQLDRAGCPSILNGTGTSGGGVSGYNSVLVNIEKWSGEALKPDCELPARVPTMAS